MKISVIGKRKIWYAISAVILLAGLVSLLVQGMNLGIDFVGGNRLNLAFEQQVEIADLRATLTENDLGDSKIQLLDDGSYLLKTRELEQELYDYLLPCYEHGLDAVLVQDMGVLKAEWLSRPERGCRAEKECSDFSDIGCAADDCLYHLSV